MSIATRAPCADSTRFEVEVLLRWAAYMTVISTTMTAASTVRVIISSTRVKPRRSVARGEAMGRMAGDVRMDLTPQVRDGLHRPGTHEGPVHRDGDLLQVVQRRGQGCDFVIAHPLPRGAERL